MYFCNFLQLENTENNRTKKSFRHSYRITEREIIMGMLNKWLDFEHLFNMIVGEIPKA